MVPERGAEEVGGTTGPGNAGVADPAGPGPACLGEWVVLKAEARTDPTRRLSPHEEAGAIARGMGLGVPGTVAKAEAPQRPVAPSPVPRDMDAGTEDAATGVAAARANITACCTAAPGPLWSKLSFATFAFFSCGAGGRPDEDEETS